MSIFKKVIAGWEKNFKKPRNPHVSRQPRFHIRPLHRVVFHRHHENERQQLALSNISKTGMGLLRQQVRDIEVGSIVKGEIEINDKGFAIEASVPHQTDLVVGCQFMGAVDELAHAIHEYFRVEIVALMLNPVAETHLKRDSAGRTAWFTDGQNNEVYFVFDDDGILTFHLSFLGNYIEGGREDRLRCGHVIEDASDGMNRYKSSPILDLKDSASHEILQLGELLIDSIHKLPRDYAQALKSLLQQGKAG